MGAAKGKGHTKVKRGKGGLYKSKGSNSGDKAESVVVSEQSNNIVGGERRGEDKLEGQVGGGEQGEGESRGKKDKGSICCSVLVEDSSILYIQSDSI